ncbi:MAG: hypothetical protein WKG01_34360 [Kofleriaceae bacterium]
MRGDRDGEDGRDHEAEPRRQREQRREHQCVARAHAREQAMRERELDDQRERLAEPAHTAERRGEIRRRAALPCNGDAEREVHERREYAGEPGDDREVPCA